MRLVALFTIVCVATPAAAQTEYTVTRNTGQSFAVEVRPGTTDTVYAPSQRSQRLTPEEARLQRMGMPIPPRGDGSITEITEVPADSINAGSSLQREVVVINIENLPITLTHVSADFTSLRDLGHSCDNVSSSLNVIAPLIGVPAGAIIGSAIGGNSNVGTAVGAVTGLLAGIATAEAEQVERERRCAEYDRTLEETFVQTFVAQWSSDVAVAAVELRFLTFDIFGHQLGDIRHVVIKDIIGDVQTNSLAESPIDRQLTTVSFVNRITFADGAVWQMDDNMIRRFIGSLLFVDELENIEPSTAVPFDVDLAMLGI